MKKNIFKFILIFIFVYFIGIGSVYAADIDYQVGKYVSGDGKHFITISSDNTVKYDDTYSLTLNKKTNGDTITGKIGTNNKSVTFYQLNESTIMSGALLNYTYDGKTVYLNDYTVFNLDKVSVEDENGKFELWHNGSKVKAYADLQSAVDAAVDGDTIKLTSDLSIDRGAYFNGKNLIIDGGNHTLTRDNWLNSLFVVEEGTTLTINNLVVEGGSNGFAVDKSGINIIKDTSTKIPIKSGSDTSDIKLSFSPIITKGKFVTNNSKYNNNYVNGDGGVINVITGELIIENSSFDHNRATGRGGSILLGRKFYSGETTFPVKNVSINNSDFKNNYSTNGGVISSLNVEMTNIDNSNFKNNTVTGGKGGVILITREGASGFYAMYEKLGLSIPKIVINDSLFDGNWVGNDGSSIENQDGILETYNTTYSNNVGIHSTSSVGTISFSTDYGSVRTMIIENCLFKNNLGSATAVGDHASKNIRIDVTNCKFIDNKSAYNAFLIYTADVNFKDCVFEYEHVCRGVVDIVSLENEASGYHANTITFENTVFNNTEYGATDILLRKYNDVDDIKTSTLIIKDGVSANIDVWHQNKLIIEGDYTGTIKVAKKTPIDNIEVKDNSLVNGKIIDSSNMYTVNLNFYGLEEKDGYNWIVRRYIYSDAKTWNEKDFYLEHQVSENGYKLVYYSDASYTTPWDYNVTGDMDIYGRWEEHTHSYNDYVVYENTIYEQCDCGYLGKKLDLVATDDLYENSNKKEVSIINELGIDENKIKVTYKKLVNNKWTDIEDIPSSVGNYKAVLTYENYEIEEEFTILKREVNPNTIDNITGMIISLIISICFIVISVILLRKKYN